jgi:hypothetical protein
MRIKPTPRALLTGILARRDPDLLTVLDAGEPARSEINGVTTVLGAELADYGLGSDSEPTAYGLLIEDLIDEVNRIGFK